MEDIFPVIYQIVDLEVDMTAGSLTGHTDLWVGVKETGFDSSSSITPDNYSCLHLHSRKCRIRKVEVNGVEVEWVHVDPLSSSLTMSAGALRAGSEVHSYLSEEVDTLLRTALEVSRHGELQIKLPLGLPLASELPPALPRRVARSRRLQEQAGRRDRALRQLASLKEIRCGSGGDSVMGDPAVPESTKELRCPKLLHVRVKYSLTPGAGTRGESSVIFRSGPSGNQSQSLSHGQAQRKLEQQQATANRDFVCLYTLPSDSYGTADVGGVRTWLPCVDTPAHRPVFEITLRVSSLNRRNGPGSGVGRELSVSCSGRLLESTTVNSGAHPTSAYRFLCLFRVTPRALGFFIGPTEQYVVPLYRSMGRVWVARGLVDIFAADGISTQTHSSSILSADKDTSDSANMTDGDADSDPSAKRRRPSPDNNIDPADDPNDEDPDIINDRDQEEVEAEGQSGGRLYRAQVRHTTLGLDLGTRLLHKFAGRRLESSQYTQVFVPGLEVDSASFEGLALIDARFLTDPTEAAQETGAHMVQLQAYIHCWLGTGAALPTDSYDSDILVHGCEAALIAEYIEAVFGEDCAAYRLQRSIDVAVALAKSGFSPPLCGPLLPESYERYLPQYRQLYLSSAANLFHALMVRLGGGDAMRNMLRFIIKAPALSQPSGGHGAGKSVRLSDKGRSGEGEEQLGASLRYLGLTASPSLQQSPTHSYTYLESPSPSSGQVSPSTGRDRYGPGSFSEGQASPSLPHMYAAYSYSPAYSDGHGSLASAHGLEYGHSLTSPNPYAGLAGTSPNPYQSLLPAIPGMRGSPNPYISSPNPYANVQTPYGASPNPYAGLHNSYGASPNPYQVQHPMVGYGLPPFSSSPNPYAVLQGHGSGPYTQAPHAYGASPSVHHAAAASPAHYGSSPNPYQQLGHAVPPYQPYSYPLSAPAYVPSPTGARSRASSFDVTGVTTSSVNGTSSRPRSGSESHTAAQAVPPTVSATTGVPPASSFPVPTAIPQTQLRHQTTFTSVASAPLSTVGSMIGSTTVLYAGSNYAPLRLDTFLETLQLVAASGGQLDGAADLPDPAQILRCLCTPGIGLARFGLYVGQKIESRPQFMTAALDHSVLRHGRVLKGPLEEDGWRDNVCLRVCELRDEVVTEPTMRVTPCTEESLQQQLYTRPGRARGTRRKGQLSAEEEAALTPVELAQRQNTRHALDQARDREEAVRYAFVDPTGSLMPGLLSEVHLVSSDAMLAEQLWSEADGTDVLRHVQSLRSMSRVPAQVYPQSIAHLVPLAGPTPTGPRGEVLRLRSMSDCLLAVAPQDNPSKVVCGGHSLAVRCEAAMALAQWQNERAPSHLSGSGGEGEGDRDDISGMWQGLNRLVEATHALYLDHSTLLPSACDWTQEADTRLRCALLLALSSVRALNGLTPPAAIKTLLLFAEYHVNTSVTAAEVFDDSYYVATLLVCLSRLRVDTYRKDDPQDPLKRVSEYAVRKLRTDLATSRARAGVTQPTEAEGDRLLPWAPGVLSLGGAVAAAALCCAAEADMQFTELLDKEEDQTRAAKGHTSILIVVGSVSNEVRDGGQVLKLLVPCASGLLSGLRYSDYFLPSGCRLLYTYGADVYSGSGVSRQSQTHVYPPPVRLSALEGYIRLCLLQASLYAEKRRRQLRLQQQQPTPQSTPVYLAAALEAALTVIHYDPDRRVRRGAALALLDCVQGRPAGRPSFAALTHGDPFALLAHADVEALTLPDPAGCLPSTQTGHKGGGGHSHRRGTGASHRELFLRAEGSVMRRSLNSLWQAICNARDEEVRAQLFRLWLYVFGADPPPALTTSSAADTRRQAEAAAAVSELKARLWGATVASEHLPKDRLTVRDPLECQQRIEQVLRHGRGYKAPVTHTHTTASSVLQQPPGVQPSGAGMRLSLSLKGAQ